MKDEMVDVLDANGNLSGQKLMKSEVHKRGLWHPVVHVWIYNSKGEILLQMRSRNKVVWPNVWDVSVGGHVTAGETPKAAGVTEAKEELGIKIKPNDISFFDLTSLQENMPGNWANRIFRWSYTIPMELNISKLQFDKEEISEIRWVAVDDLENELNDSDKAGSFPADANNSFRTAINEIRKRLKK